MLTWFLSMLRTYIYVCMLLLYVYIMMRWDFQRKMLDRKAQQLRKLFYLSKRNALRCDIDIAFRFGSTNTNLSLNSLSLFFSLG